MVANRLGSFSGWFAGSLIVVLCIVTSKHHLQVSATFSMAGSDRTSNQVGAAGASCSSSSLYDEMYHSHGRGVLLVQGKIPPKPVLDSADALLEANTDPADMIGTLTNPSRVGFLDTTTTTLPVSTLRGDIAVTEFDDYTLRQYGSVRLALPGGGTNNKAAGYTGTNMISFYLGRELLDAAKESGMVHAEHFAGATDNFAYSAQGNLVTPPTVPLLVDTFTMATTRSGDDVCDTDLVGRLYHSIMAPFLTTGAVGDVRCLHSANTSAAGIFLHVDEVRTIDDGSASTTSNVVHIDIVQSHINSNEDVTPLINPMDAFVEAYQTWRASNPCPGRGTMHPTAGMDLANRTGADDTSGGSTVRHVVLVVLFLGTTVSWALF